MEERADQVVIRQGSSFGELALLYGHPRAASAFLIERSTLWAVDRIMCRKIQLRKASPLNSVEREKDAKALVARVYEDEETVVTQGEIVRFSSSSKKVKPLSLRLARPRIRVAEEFMVKITGQPFESAKWRSLKYLQAVYLPLVLP
ncbi:hypothetical protein BDZ89DRAFT_1108677 [Hymenopellis radicata]|nr:hypothetical protein BDZ89DRAFT_1108677 [Hymenopellis radicata]